MYKVFVPLLEKVVLVLFAAAAAGGAVAAQSTGSDRNKTPNFTGAWTLNQDLGDNVAKLLETMQSGDHGGYNESGCRRCRETGAPCDRSSSLSRGMLALERFVTTQGDREA